MYAVTAGENAGYIPSQYVAFSKKRSRFTAKADSILCISQEEAMPTAAVTPRGLTTSHGEKGSFEDNVMPGDLPDALYSFLARGGH